MKTSSLISVLTWRHTFDESCRYTLSYVRILSLDLEDPEHQTVRAIVE